MIRENTNTIGGGVMYSSSCRGGVVLRQLSEKLAPIHESTFQSMCLGPEFTVRSILSSAHGRSSSVATTCILIIRTDLRIA